MPCPWQNPASDPDRRYHQDRPSHSFCGNFVGPNSEITRSDNPPPPHTTPHPTPPTHLHPAIPPHTPPSHPTHPPQHPHPTPHLRRASSSGGGAGTAPSPRCCSASPWASRTSSTSKPTLRPSASAGGVRCGWVWGLVEETENGASEGGRVFFFWWGGGKQGPKIRGGGGGGGEAGRNRWDVVSVGLPILGRGHPR